MLLSEQGWCLRFSLGFSVFVLLTVLGGARDLLDATSVMPTSLTPIPLYFESRQNNDAQVPRFVAHAGGLSLILTPDGVVVRLPSETGVRSMWRMRLIGSNPSPTLKGLDLRVGRSHLLIGAVQAAWRTHVSHYARVQYENIYSEIDLIYYGINGNLAFDFLVGPGADPSRIQIAFEQVSQMSAPLRLSIDPDGNLIVRAGEDEIRLNNPHVYQGFKANKRVIPGKFILQAHQARGGDVSVVRFQVGEYDHSQPLVIDPVLTYSTRLGGLTGLTRGNGIAVDQDGMVYVVGETFDDIFPTENAVRSSLGGSVDAFVTKIDPRTDEVIYSTRLGGSGIDKGLSITLDDNGQAYVTGSTGSGDFPTENPCQATFGGGSGALGDAFIAVLGEDGSELLYSSYLGGGDDDVATSIAIDQRGMVFVTGETRSTDFPLQSPLQPEFGGGIADAFIAAFDPFECPSLYTTYLGGEGDDVGSSITVDSGGHAYVTGETRSPDFPTVSFKQARLAGGVDAFVAKLEHDGSALVYSTYLGGSDSDRGRGIAVDSSGHAYVTGRTDSSDFPTTSSVVQSMAAGAGDAFVSKFNFTGTTLLYSTYLGGSELDEGRGIAVDSRRHAYVIGRTASPDFFEVTPLQEGFGGGQDVFLTKLGPRGSTLGYSTYIGGAREDVGTGVTRDVSGNAYITGTMRSVDFQTIGTFRNLLSQASSGAAFVAKIDRGNVLALDLPDLLVRLDQSKFGTRSSGDRVVFTFTVQNIGKADVRDPFLITMRLSDNNRADGRGLVVQSVKAGRLASGHKVSYKLKATGLDSTEGRFIVIRVDDEDLVIESNELNNAVVERVK